LRTRHAVFHHSDQWRGPPFRTGTLFALACQAVEGLAFSDSARSSPHKATGGPTFFFSLPGLTHPARDLPTGQPPPTPTTRTPPTHSHSHHHSHTQRHATAAQNHACQISVEGLALCHTCHFARPNSPSQARRSIAVLACAPHRTAGRGPTRNDKCCPPQDGLGGHKSPTELSYLAHDLLTRLFAWADPSLTGAVARAVARLGGTFGCLRESPASRVRAAAGLKCSSAKTSGGA
jgi:hypothetical protein